MEIGTASFNGRTVDEANAEIKRALDKADAWKEAANSLANLHPHEWTELYAAALKRRGLTN
jgi:hypothetical protein